MMGGGGRCGTRRTLLGAAPQASGGAAKQCESQMSLDSGQATVSYGLGAWRAASPPNDPEEADERTENRDGCGVDAASANDA